MQVVNYTGEGVSQSVSQPLSVLTAPVTVDPIEIMSRVLLTLTSLKTIAGREGSN